MQTEQKKPFRLTRYLVKRRNAAEEKRNAERKRQFKTVLRRWSIEP